MKIDTTRVSGRRVLRYASLEEVLADAERLTDSNARMLGNWSLGQVLQHLAVAVNGSIDGFSFSWPWPGILFARLFLKRRILTRGLIPGLGRSPRWDSVKPPATSSEDGLEALRTAIARLSRETRRLAHPALGRMTAEEWYQFHLRHAELHLSFALPSSGQQP